VSKTTATLSRKIGESVVRCRFILGARVVFYENAIKPDIGGDDIFLPGVAATISGNARGDERRCGRPSKAFTCCE
jgi:hypothetical protein